MTSRVLPRIEPASDAFHDLLQALVQREERDDQLGRVTERDVQDAADAGARSRGQLLGRAP
jgi:hypothetical protein